MSITTINDIFKFKDNNDQISASLENGNTLSQACAEVGLTNNNTSFITEQMTKLMNNSLFQQNTVGRLGWGNNITHNGQTQCGVYTVATGGRAKIDIDLNDDGEISEDEKGVDAAQAMAASYDSELDLYIEDSIQEFIEKYCGNDTAFWWDGRGFMQPEMQEKLYQEYGIVINQVGDDRRTYSFSLVDQDGNVLEDANGNKGSILWGDWVIPDGFAQGAELNLSSILDSIGYDCVSKADFAFNEELGGEAGYNAMIEALHEDVANTLDLTSSSAYTGEESKYTQISDRKVDDMYGATQIISLASGGGTGNTVVDKTTNKMIDILTDMGIDMKDIYEGVENVKDATKEVVDKAKELLGVKSDDEKEEKTEDNDEIIEEAVEEYEKRFQEASKVSAEENEEIDTDKLAKEVAEEFGIDIDILMDEIK